MILSRHMIRILALPPTRQLDIKALNDFARYYVSSSLTEQSQPVIQEFNNKTLEHKIFLRYSNNQKSLK